MEELKFVQLLMYLILNLQMVFVRKVDAIDKYSMIVLFWERIIKAAD